MKNFVVTIFVLFLTGNSLIAAEAGMPQLDPKYWASQSFWLIIIFLSIYFLIGRVFIPKIKSNIDAREDKIRKDLEEAKTFREEAEKKLKIYKDLIESAKIDSKKILSESRQKLNNFHIKLIEIDLNFYNKTLEFDYEKSFYFCGCSKYLLYNKTTI